MSRENYELTGQKMQGYTISKAIGQGKFSIVYRAQNEQGVPFALKKIKIFDMADQKQREKCLREVDIMKKLNHPHIIKYIDSFIHNSELIIVTQWAEKGDLKKLIKQKQSEDLQFQQSMIWDFMRQISSALQHMHEKRIMHRDLKPANIFISQDNTLKIGDLGLGRSFSSETLEAYSKVGTPLYMSPELIQDSGYTENADVWSLGCICYELAELKSPFRNKQQKMSLMDLFDNITQCNYKPIDSRFSPQLKQALKNMIVVNTQERWSSEMVYNYAVKCLEEVVKKSITIDPIIAMDDISIKLGLLEYEKMFCKVVQRRPINRIYFAFKDHQEDKLGKTQKELKDLKESGQFINKSDSQLFYFLELAYWIMGLSKSTSSTKKERLALTTKTHIDWTSPQSACVKLLQDLTSFGLKLDQSIRPKDILNGYGQAVCYLLNQLLTRELIRINFQFKPPSSSLGLNTKGTNGLDEYDEQNQNNNSRSQKEIQEEDRPIDEHDLSLQEESQFEQSILFNKNNRRDPNNHLKNNQLISKIQELQQEQNKMMIVGRVDPQEWKLECGRLDKKFTEMVSQVKNNRKKMGEYGNSQTVRLNSAKLVDLIKYVRPNTEIVFNNISSDLEIIKKGESRLKNTYQNNPASDQSYSSKQQLLSDLSMKVSSMTTSIRETSELLEKTQQKNREYQQKIRLSMDNSQNNRCGDLKKAVSSMEKEILEMEQKREMVSWQLRKMMMNQSRNGGKMGNKKGRINTMEFDQNDGGDNLNGQGFYQA